MSTIIYEDMHQHWRRDVGIGKYYVGTTFDGLTLKFSDNVNMCNSIHVEVKVAFVI